MEKIKNEYKLSFAAIDQYVESNIIKPLENDTSRGFIT